YALGDGEDCEERSSKDDSADSGYRLGSKIYQCRGEQHHEDRKQPQRNLSSEDCDIRRHLPTALAFVFEAQDEHGETIEGETTDHAEGISLAEDDHISAAQQNGDDLQTNDEVHDPIAGSVSLLRLAKPVGEYPIFGNPVQHAVRADD